MYYNAVTYEVDGGRCINALADGFQSVSNYFQKGINVTIIEVRKQFIGFFLQLF